MRSLILIALLGCSGSSSKPPVDPAVPAADPAPCAGVATNALKLADPDVSVDQVKAIVERHCRDDKWSVELRTCMITGKTPNELDGCAKDFDGTQKESLQADIKALVHQPRDPVAPAAPSPDIPPAANTLPK